MLAIIAFFAKYRQILVPLGITLGVIAILLGLYQCGRASERRDQAEASAAAQAAADLRAATATGVAASERAADQAGIRDDLNQTREIINGEPDSAPSAAAIAHNCRRLCDQGTDLATVSPCRGFATACKAVHQH